MEFSIRRPRGVIEVWCVSEEKINQLLKSKGKKLLIDLLINIIFCKLMFPLNFEAKFFLNKGLVCELRT